MHDMHGIHDWGIISTPGQNGRQLPKRPHTADRSLSLNSYTVVSRKPRGRRAALVAALARLEREHVALLLAICELETPQQDDHQSQALREALLPMLREDLRQTQHALARAAHGAYGTCEDCHKPLSLRELEAHPAATHCAICNARLRHSPRR
jgi:RNA polymerase-binding transcription factor DksA